jgi:hypothetical protein
MALIKGKQLSQNSVSLNRLALANEAEVLVANGSGQLTAVAMSGDIAVVASGQTTVQANAITASKVADGAITFAKLNGSGISSDLSSSASATELARADAAKSYADARYTAATTYADNLVQGLDVKDSVRIATTAAGTLASSFENGDTIDGVALVTGNRILIKDQADAKENGIYVVQASGAPARAADAGQGELTGGLFVFVEEGTVNSDAGFVCTTNGTPTLGSDNIVFAQFSGAGSVGAGVGISKTGNTLDLDLNSLTGVSVAIAQDSIALIDGSDSNNTKKASLTSFATSLATAIAGSGITPQGGGIISAPRMASGDQFEAASATSSDGDTSGVTIAAAPAGMVNVIVNGIMQELGQGVKTKDCYFSADGGSTARAISAIAANDTLYWNGSVAGFQLDTNDKITLSYELK